MQLRGAPACDISLFPADTAIFWQHTVLFTGNVLRLARTKDLPTNLFSQFKGAFSSKEVTLGQPQAKPEVRFPEWGSRS